MNKKFEDWLKDEGVKHHKRNVYSDMISTFIKENYMIKFKYHAPSFYRRYEKMIPLRK